MQATADDLTCLLALNRVSGIGPIVLARLLARFGDAEGVFRASSRALEEALAGIPNRSGIVGAIGSGPKSQAVEADRRWLATGRDRAVVCFSDAAYPARLKQIPDPPPLLFVEGPSEELAAPQVAIVGSRSCTTLGRELAREFAYRLSTTGFAITSGLASGIDSAAHAGALAGGGVTLAVFGCGPDIIYPRTATALARQIVDSGGVLISEFSTGIAPHPTHFPRRNRIISGLTLGTVVVEAAMKSGSLITARLAAEQGREVFALPGSLRNPRARGCHHLIREGATLVESADHVIEALAPQLTDLLTVRNPADGQIETGDREDSTLATLGFEPFSVDDVCTLTGLTPEAVSTKLLRYELEGVVAPSPGGRYVRLK